jgi:hypothetical protein
MRIKSLAHKNQMGKKKITNASTSWVPSEFGQSDLTKAQKDGFITEGDQVIFPSTERIPKPLSGYRVMFFAFLLRGLSLISHEFLRRLLFVYGVQLHQLTPNSILHIACFITLCESFLGVDPHWTMWKSLFRLRPSVSLSKNPELGGAVVSVRSEGHYLEFSMAASVQGWQKKWFYIKDQKISSSNQFGVAPFDANQRLQKLSSWDSPPTESEVEELKCRGFINRSAIGVGVWQFVEGGEHGGAIQDGCSTSLPSFRTRNGGETLRAAIIHYMATSARLQ